MRVKRYVVKDMQEAMHLIKEDLGKEAIIISSNKVRAKGFWGFLGAKMLEVTAAVERADEKKVELSLTQAARSLLPNESSHKLEKELEDMKVMLHRLLNSTGQGQGTEARWKQALECLEIHPSIAEELVAGLDEAFRGDESDDNLVKEALRARLAGMFQEISAQPGQGKLFALVGPTGVGKTTTLAKLAAHYAFSLNKKVGMITIDTYRIGAVEQLRTYGNIMGVDVEVVMTPAELDAAVKNNEDKDVIFIDTAGRSPSDSMKLSEVRTFLEVVRPLEVYLVLSCTTKQEDLDRIASEYRILDYTSLIFTKVDETKTFGSIINVAYGSKTPVAFLTNGQDVPDDIEIAEPYKLAQLILGEVT